MKLTKKNILNLKQFLKYFHTNSEKVGNTYLYQNK